jgi:hypothetical protein
MSGIYARIRHPRYLQIDFALMGCALIANKGSDPFRKNLREILISKMILCQHTNKRKTVISIRLTRAASLLFEKASLQGNHAPPLIIDWVYPKRTG